MGKGMLRMRTVILLPLQEGETKSEAEDRMIELLTKEGVTLIAWDESEIIGRDYVEREDADGDIN